MRQTTAFCAPLVFALLLWSACDVSVDPFLESDRYFTLFGNLDMNADTQYVRVIPIGDSLTFDPAGPLEAEVRSTDLVTDEVVVWRDSLILFDDGTAGHVFYMPRRVQPAHTYLFEVERSDGQATRVRTTMPPLPRVEIEAPVQPFGAAYVQSVRWLGIEREPFQTKVVYRFLATASTRFTDITLPYPVANQAAEDEPDWVLLVRLSEDKQEIQRILPNFSELLFMGVAMEVTLLDEAFVPPGGVFEREVLVQPGTFSNVENGFGFLGSIARFSVEWVLPEEVANELDLTVPKAARTSEPIVDY